MILLINYFNSCEKERNKEIEYCLRKNINSDLFDEIILFYEMNTFIPLEFDGFIREVLVEKRPTYKEMISFLQNEYRDKICILANTDIFFDDTLKLVNYIDFDKNVICLSRYEYNMGDETHYIRKEEESKFSQDSWIFNSSMKYNLDEANFTMGIPRCDGRIAFIFENSGFKVINPSLSIFSYHCHFSEIRNYVCGVHRVEGEIKIINPSFLLI